MTTTQTVTHSQTVTAANARLRKSAALSVAATASVLAGIIHYMVLPAHLAEWWVYGASFTLLGMFELVWAALVYTGRDRAVLLIGLLVNLAVLVLWAVTRTTGLPFGPEPGKAEAVGISDLLGGAAEAMTVLAVLYAFARSKRSHRA